ncbi:RNA polymerase sigma factor SigZ [Sulfuricystis multivorans]|uniref:RNA polymerase sigma factor SigZ n=1 Tax=Sulfuricystis multivorans TaxID=2211108 RepID=UPI000F823764|nr:RNA polymerase sigma factor SigZ [Sulfuricystis multivorans]
MNCIIDAWQKHEAELRRFLRYRAHDDAAADDLLQEVFLRALRQKNGLCGIDNPRAWLFQTARNLLIDRLRLTKEQVELPPDLAAETHEPAPPVDGLVQCLPRVLAELSPQDREAIQLCDIEGMTQQEYARRLGLTLPAAKSRVQRARARLKARISEACQVRYDETGRVETFTPRQPV